VYLNNPNGLLLAFIKEVFNSFKKFKEELVKAFRDIREFKIVENKLFKIC
jgi:superoxide dismutase